MVSDMEFSVQWYAVYRCDAPSCTNRPAAEVRLEHPRHYLGHHQVCEKHVKWARHDLAQLLGKLIAQGALDDPDDD